MKPTFAEIKQNSYGSTTNKLSTIWSKDGGCPSGTVPIKRITKDDLIRQRNMPPPEPANFDDEFVIVRYFMNNLILLLEDFINKYIINFKYCGKNSYIAIHPMQSNNNIEQKGSYYQFNGYKVQS